MPPMPRARQPAAFFSGCSATIASVVTSRPATDAASCSASAHDLGRVDDAGLHHVDILAGLGVEAVVGVVLVEQLADDDRAVDAGVLGDLAHRRLQRAADDVDADLLVVVVGLQLGERLGGVEQRDAAAGDDAFLDRGAGRVHRVVDAVLALLHLDLGGAADADHRDAAGELGQPLLQLLAVVVGGGLLDLRADLADAGLRCPPSCRRRR